MVLVRCFCCSAAGLRSFVGVIAALPFSKYQSKKDDARYAIVSSSSSSTACLEGLISLYETSSVTRDGALSLY